ncbi:hypothetical protein [Marinigracilibium pacificum]|uniref:Outer membrane protein beta-barrel domain-containing protein n=1 Tax=Marinigracilibium pacificum TaxID=2729599 RepID=A0A848J111_9BACT|nr:hypothetical protein [Marinigracilibium pacificum]NMM49205.1 hypothetical protein [Marinigracilibium pacificum]
MKEQDSDHNKEYWASRLDGLEVTPPPSVWRGVKAAMDADRASKYRATAKFYRRIAASLILLILGMGGFGAYLYDQNLRLKNEMVSLSLSESQLALTTSENAASQNDLASSNELFAIDASDNSSVQNISADDFGDNQVSNSIQSLAHKSAPSTNHDFESESGNQKNNNTNAILNNSIASTNSATNIFNENITVDENYILLNELSGRSLAFNLKPELKDPEIEGVAVLDWDEVTRLRPGKSRSVANNNNEPLWLGVNMGSGNVNQNFSQSELTLAELIEEDIEPKALKEGAGFNTEALPGPSFTAGVEVGGKLADRFVLQGGMSYLYQAAISSSNVAFGPESGSSSQTLNISNIRELKEQRNTTELSFIKETELKTSYEYLSFPVRAGYIFLDKRFGITGNAGVIADVFMAGKVFDAHSKSELTRFGNGENSPYNSFNFRAAGSLMLSYDFESNIKLLIEPSYSHAISSYTKLGSSLNSNPYSFMISAGLKYKFK